MKLPKIGESQIVDGKKLTVTGHRRIDTGLLLVEWTGPGETMGCCIPSYWYEKNERDRRAGSGAPS